MTYKEIQAEVIAKYRITINEHSECRTRTHAHIKTRMLCKWSPKNSFLSTFTLLHEVGHIETHKSWMRRAESEYYATEWAIDRCKEYGLQVDEHTLHVYQRYILLEVARGIRRGGAGYDIERMNLYAYYGISKSIEEFKTELEPNWARVIVNWV